MAIRKSSSDSWTLIRRLTAFAAAPALVVALAACAGGGSPATEGETSANEENQLTQVAIVTPETEADHGWNKQGVLGAEIAAENLGLELEKNLGVGYDNTETILVQVADGGSDLVIAHAAGFATAGARAAATSGVPMLIVEDTSAQEPGVVGVMTFEVYQGSYLAGIAAAMTTESGTLGIVSSAENTNFFGYAGGFIQGARSVNPDIDIVMAYIGANSYGDSAGGKQVTSQIIAAGADVIIGMGNGATVGYLAAIEEASIPVRYISTIGPVDDLVDDPATILATVQSNFEIAFQAALEALERGNFGEDLYALNVVNDGISLEVGADLAPDVADAVEAARAGIVDGSVTVEPILTKDAVESLLNE